MLVLNYKLLVLVLQQYRYTPDESYNHILNIDLLQSDSSSIPRCTQEHIPWYQMKGHDITISG